jgi:hypothetical protein
LFRSNFHTQFIHVLSGSAYFKVAGKSGEIHMDYISNLPPFTQLTIGSITICFEPPQQVEYSIFFKVLSSISITRFIPCLIVGYRDTIPQKQCSKKVSFHDFDPIEYKFF